MIILTVSRRTKLAAAEMKEHMTAGHKHYASIYLLRVLRLTCIYTFTAAVADICGPKWRTKKCLTKPPEPISRQGCDECSAAGDAVMCHWTMLEPCSCILSHTAPCRPLQTTPCWWQCYDAIMCDGVFTLNPDLVTCNTTLSCNTGPLLSTIWYK